MFRKLALTTTFLTALAFPVIAQEAEPVAETENDPRAAAIIETMTTLSELSEGNLSQAIANLMVAFTAVTEQEEFLNAIGMWNAQLASSLVDIDPDAPLQIEPQALMDSMTASNWISAGGEGPVLHYYMDPACDLCVETLGVLGAMAADGDLDLRVTLLPLVEDTSFALTLGLLSDRNTAWQRLTGFLAGEIPAEDIAIEPDAENEALQALIEADYDAFIASGIRSIPFMGFMDDEGAPRFIQGSLSLEEAEALILGQ